MPKLSALENSRLNITTLAVPEIATEVNWLTPEAMFPKKIWNELMRKISEEQRHSNVGNALNLASNAAILFPDRLAEIPVSGEYCQGLISSYVNGVLDDADENTATDFLEDMAFIRNLFPEKVNRALVRYSGAITIGKRIMDRFKERMQWGGWSSLAVDYCKAIGRVTTDVFPIDDDHVDSILKSARTRWWSAEHTTAHFLRQAVPFVYFYPDVAKELAPPDFAKEEIKQRLLQIKDVGIDAYTQATISLLMITAKEVKITPAGVQIIYKETSSSLSSHDDQPIPPMRDF